MAIQTIQFDAPQNETITVKLYEPTSDSVAATATSVAESANRPGTYTAVVESSLSGVFKLYATDSSNVVLAKWWVRIENTNGTYVAYEIPNAGSISTLTKEQVNNELVDVLTVDIHGEPTAVPPATSSIRDKLSWLFIQARNKMTQSKTTKTIYADDGTTIISTAQVSDDGETFVKNKETNA